MIYDRHEDISATTKRHPAVVRHRTGVTSDGALVAQEIEVVMDGGAYCTLTPVVLSRGALHAGGPYRCPNVRIRGRAMATNTPPNGAFRGFGAPQTEFAAEMQVNRIAEALGVSPLELRRRWVYVEGDTTPTGQVLRESVGGSEVLEAAAEASAFETHRQRTQEARELRRWRRAARFGHRAGAGLARRRLHRQRRGPPGVGRVARADRRPPDPDPDRLDRDGPGHQDDLPAAGRRQRWASSTTRSRSRRRTPRSCPTPAPPSPAARRWSSAGCSSRRRSASAPRSRRRPAAASPTPIAQARPRRVDEQFEPYPGVNFDDATYTGDAYPAFGWAAAVARVDVDLDTGEVTVREVVSADDIGRVIHPVLAEGQVEGGTLQAVGYATIEEMKLVDGRYLNDRLATYLIPTALDAPRIEHPGREAVLRRAPRRQGRRRAAHGRRRAGGGRRHPRRDRRLDPRPARDAGADPGRPDAWTDASATRGLGRAARPEGPADRGSARRRRRDPASLPHRPAQDFIP